MANPLLVVALLAPVLCGCALDLRGLQRDEAEQAVPTAPQSMEAAADGSVLPSADVVVEAPSSPDATRDLEDGPARDATHTDAAYTGAPAEDARGEGGDTKEGGGARAKGDASPTDAVSGAPTCVLPLGATICCGSVPCADDKVACSSPSECEVCQATCSDPAKPVCCAIGPLKVTCVSRPNEC